VSRHVVAGTAGHVDHGKTALVKLLTGTDTDRWAEEKRRGITIDLGFALLDLGNGLTASIVDVPGHEDFVRNMVAGATGVDVALMVVAADEGVMPQTVEHLAILEFLGVAAGVVVISKVDLAEPEWLELVQADVAERLGKSAIRWEPAVRFSAETGEGEAAVREALARARARAGAGRWLQGRRCGCFPARCGPACGAWRSMARGATAPSQGFAPRWRSPV
jgi:selenocysteine-specific elongation factor